jgi:hypothetical protein
MYAPSSQLASFATHTQGVSFIVVVVVARSVLTGRGYGEHKLITYWPSLGDALYNQANVKKSRYRNSIENRKRHTLAATLQIKKIK